MLNFFLYVSASLIWGSTWLAITFQLGEVDPAQQVGVGGGIGAAVGSHAADPRVDRADAGDRLLDLFLDFPVLRS